VIFSITLDLDLDIIEHNLRIDVLFSRLVYFLATNANDLLNGGTSKTRNGERL
jgi:hypothetical protein